jgi:cytochrome P450
MSAPGAVLTADATALRIFLRLIRPRPLEDPYPLYAQLREMAPFLPVRFPGVPDGYLVTTFAGCSRLLRAPAFGPPTYPQLDALNPGWRENAFTRCIYRTMVFLGGPSHRERRQVASRYFTPRQIGRYRAQLDEIAGVLIDRLAGPGSGPVDLVEQLALPFASLSLGRLLAIADDEAIRPPAPPDDLSNQVIRIAISGAQPGISSGSLAPSLAGWAAISPVVNFTRLPGSRLVLPAV